MRLVRVYPRCMRRFLSLMLVLLLFLLFFFFFYLAIITNASQLTNHTAPPIHMMNIPAVRIPAPALSAVVTGPPNLISSERLPPALS